MPISRTIGTTRHLIGDDVKPSRGASLAALVLIAVAAPVAAYSLADDSGAPSPASVSPGNSDHPHGRAKPPKAAEPETTDEAGQAAESSAAGRAHAAAMKEWARCVADAASGPKAEGAPRPPKLACDEKPMGPGRAKHLAASTDTDAPGKSGEKKPKTDRPRGPRR